MKTTRRGFFGVLATAVGTVALKPEAKPVEIRHDELSRHTFIDGVRIADVDIIGSGYTPRLMQEGVHKLFKETYENHSVEWEAVFLDNPKGLS